METQKKKILFVITKSNWGGAGRYVYDLATALPKEEFDTLLVSGNVGLLTQKLHEAGIRTVSIANLQRDVSLIDELSSFFKLVSIFRREKPNIVHLNSSKAGGLGALAARVCGIRKIIFTAHGWPFNENRGVVTKSIIWLFSWITALLSTDVIVIARKELAQAKQMPFIGSKVALIHNGISTIDFLSRKEAREKLGLEEDAYVIGSIGELTKNKNYLRLISAAAILKEKGGNFILTIIGDGEDRQKIISSIKNKTNLSEQDVLLPGFIQEGYTFLPAFDSFILPSLKEGLPYVLLEAGRAGLPVVASSVGGIGDIVENHVSGMLVDPHDPSSIAQALATIKENKALSMRLGNALKEKVEREFSLSLMLEKTLFIYRS